MVTRTETKTESTSTMKSTSTTKVQPDVLTVEDVREFRAKVIKYSEQFEIIEFGNSDAELLKKLNARPRPEYLKGLVAEKMICQLLALEMALKL